ncbi:unnamed protein product [Moneuplotes crassus]|uniref:Uncharacterized protein n=1 Tax=Euplotes crassus TaxID=5936 RepID=A0AAD2DCM7_EUPCR|nr:unnamed protein product [Moneuplotes crassus]
MENLGDCKVEDNCCLSESSDSPEIPDWSDVEIQEDDGVYQSGCSDILFELTPNLFDGDLIDLKEFEEVGLNKSKSSNGKEKDVKKVNIQDETTASAPLQKFTAVVSQPEETKLGKEIQRRWGRKQDKILFKTIREMEKQQIITLDELLNLDPTLTFKDDEAIQELCIRSKWNAHPGKLLTRIQSLSKHEFSFREIKELKKILRRKYNYKNIDYNEAIYEFPGKSMAALKKMINQIKDSFKNQSLCDLKGKRKWRKQRT